MPKKIPATKPIHEALVTNELLSLTSTFLNIFARNRDAEQQIAFKTLISFWLTHTPIEEQKKQMEETYSYNINSRFVISNDVSDSITHLLKNDIFCGMEQHTYVHSKSVDPYLLFKSIVNDYVSGQSPDVYKLQNILKDLNNTKLNSVQKNQVIDLFSKIPERIRNKTSILNVSPSFLLKSEDGVLLTKLEEAFNKSKDEFIDLFLETIPQIDSKIYVTKAFQTLREKVRQLCIDNVDCFNKIISSIQPDRKVKNCICSCAITPFEECIQNKIIAPHLIPYRLNITSLSVLDDCFRSVSFTDKITTMQNMGFNESQTNKAFEILLSDSSVQEKLLSSASIKKDIEMIKENTIVFPEKTKGLIYLYSNKMLETNYPITDMLDIAFEKTKPSMEINTDETIDVFKVHYLNYKLTQQLAPLLEQAPSKKRKI